MFAGKLSRGSKKDNFFVTLFEKYFHLGFLVIKNYGQKLSQIIFRKLQESVSGIA